MDERKLYEPTMSKHAKERWEQRCPTLSLEYEWNCSRLAGGRVKKKIIASCPNHAKDMIRGSGEVSYYISPNKVVFVVNSSNVIVTVFTLH